MGIERERERIESKMSVLFDMKREPFISSKCL